MAIGGGDKGGRGGMGVSEAQVTSIRTGFLLGSTTARTT